jgi:hypothetical protein
MDEIITRVLLIDLENCPSQINQLMNHLGEYSHIVICYAQSGAKIPVDWIIPLTTTVNEGRLKLIKMPEVGKNAADFGIAFWAGVLMAQLPENTHFDIVSNDTDLDYVVSLLTAQKRSAERRGIKKELIALAPVKAVSIPVVVTSKITALSTVNYYLLESCLFLNGMPNNKPVKKETLLNSIKSKFKTAEVDVDENKVFESLLTNGIISLNENKIVYNQHNLNKFAAII